MIHLTFEEEFSLIFTKPCYHIQNIKRTKHEYWSTEMYDRHLAEPVCNKWRPECICYTYPDNKFAF